MAPEIEIKIKRYECGNKPDCPQGAQAGKKHIYRGVVNWADNQLVKGPAKDEQVK